MKEPTQDGPVMRGAISAPGEGFGLEVVVQGVVRRWRLVVLVVALAPTFAAVLWRMWPAKYEARARVTVRAPQEVNPFMQEMVVEWNAEDQTERIASILLNPSTLETVLRAIGRVSPSMSASDIDALVKDTSERMLVTQVGGGVVLLKLTATDPQQALMGVRGLIDAFVSEMLRPQRESLEAASRFLADELERVSREVEDRERFLTAYRTEHVVALPEMRQATFAEHLALRTALVDAEVREQGSARQVQTVGERLRTFSARERSVETLLAEARAGLVRTRATYEGDHPHVVQAEERVRRIERELAAAHSSDEPANLELLDARMPEPRGGAGANAMVGADLLTSELLAYRTVLREQEGATAQRSLLRGRIVEVETNIAHSLQIEREVSRMERSLHSLVTLQAELRERLERAQVMRAFARDASNQQVWVLEPPRLPTKSNKQPLVLVMLGAALGGLVAAMAAISLLEARSTYVRTTRELCTLLGARDVAVLPALDAR